MPSLCKSMPVTVIVAASQGTGFAYYAGDGDVRLTVGAGLMYSTTGTGAGYTAGEM